MRPIELSGQLRADFESEAIELAPREALALALARPRPECLRIEELFPVANVAEDPLKGFRLDPRAWPRARKRAMEQGLDLLAVVHSHPAGGAAISARDQAALARLFASGPSWPYLVCARDPDGSWSWSAWALDDLNPFEIEVYGS